MSCWALITAASLKQAAEFIRGVRQRNEEVGGGREDEDEEDEVVQLKSRNSFHSTPIPEGI